MTVHLPPPHSLNFQKIFAFSALFWPNFPDFCSQDPSFFKENPPYFWKLVWHTPTKKKKKLSAPPIRGRVAEMGQPNDDPFRAKTRV